MPDNKTTTGITDSSTPSDLPTTPDGSPPDRKTAASARRTARTGTTRAAATDTTATGGTRAGKRTKKPRTSTAAAAGSPRPDSTDHGPSANAHDDVSDRLWGALRAQPAATSAELAIAARLPRATVTALLTTWLAEGSVTSSAGATARAAHRWTAVHTALPAATAAPQNGSTSPEPAHAAAATVDRETPDPVTTEPVADKADVATAADAASPQAPPLGAPSSAPTPDESESTRSVRPPVPTRNPSGSRRLPGGALRGMVEDHLRDHPEAAWGPVAIGKALHRSSGAVANALEALVTQNVAHRTSDRPKRYRLADQPEPQPDTTATAHDVATTASADESVPVGLTQ